MANVWINGKLRRILVGYDGSVECERALEAAIALGDGCESRLLVLAVARPPEPELSRGTNALDTAREHLERTLTRLRSRVRGEGIEIETQVTQGHPAEEIIRKAREDQVDLIVVGRLGMSRREERTLGSIAQHVLSHAPCPVMVTK
jgi:nucleotide-binding universal stress UspA family protein